MAFWTDNISNISDEELCKDDLMLDSILAKEVTVSEDPVDRGSATSDLVVDLSQSFKRASWTNDKGVNLEESQAVDLSVMSSKAPCSIRNMCLWRNLLSDQTSPKKRSNYLTS